MRYISSVEVVYGDGSEAIDKQDINKGFGGEYVYLVPRYTTDRSKAASGFSVHTSFIEDLEANDISKGDGSTLYRYIHTHYYLNNSDMRVVSSVHLREEEMGDGNTGNLNKDRGGRFLYLCWKYAD
ncbi:uncharacterized protein LAJ45_06164 [Morchella importuna]|uniref:uncharacterized protein n=1 Tax=Morchella importuna TaxID=1174673 RepID=UPI001E8D08FD|nr:uncharacterized protein LAJ45_06164 [Morchella importuna]KAH8149536.1 hypothetical protein LAJ45_06164 [Morchella importuna]